MRVIDGVPWYTTCLIFLNNEYEEGDAELLARYSDKVTTNYGKNRSPMGRVLAFPHETHSSKYLHASSHSPKWHMGYHLNGCLVCFDRNQTNCNLGIIAPLDYAYLPVEQLKHHGNDPDTHFHLAGKDAIHPMTQKTTKYRCCCQFVGI